MKEESPLRDVFAVQGMLAVLLCILVSGLHLLAPEYCRELLAEWKKAVNETPDLIAFAEALMQQIRTWFAFISGA